MSLTTSISVGLVRHLWQHLNLSQEKFAAKLGVSGKAVSWWEKGHSLVPPVALKLVEKLIEELLKLTGVGEALRKHYFPEGGDV